jgi:hypothetical protein
MRLIVTMTALAIACGGNAVQPTTTIAPSASTAALATPPPVVHDKIASDAMLAAWPIAEPFVFFYADLERAFRPDAVFAKVVGSLGALASTSVPAAQLNCVRDALLASKEVVGGEHGGVLVVFRVDRARAPSQLRACFSANAVSASVRGADDAWTMDEYVVAVSRDIVAIGTKAHVEEALDRQGAGAARLRAFGLADDEVMRMHLESGSTFDAAVFATAARTWARAEIATRSEHEAKQITQSIAGAASLVPPGHDPAEHDALVRLVSALHATRDQKTVKIAFALDGSATDQARDFELGVAFLKRSIDDYLIETKQVEARNTVGAIAKDIVMWWEREEMTPQATANKRKRLLSFPAVPSTVPRGVKFETKPGDWKAWDALKFEMDQPQYYQYEVRASKDGQSATVIARGDLDGNGKTSLFELALKVDHGRIVVAPSITETNPAE